MIININEFPEYARNASFSATTYPSTGAYYDKTTDTIYFADKGANLVLSLNYGNKFLSTNTPIVSSPSISMNDVLKAIAISQDPNLAKELTSV